MTGEVLRLRAEELEWRLADDEVVVLDLRRQRYLALNASGALIWRALAKGAGREELVGLLVATYGVSPGRAAADVEDLLASMAAESLLAPLPPDPPRPGQAGAPA